MGRCEADNRRGPGAAGKSTLAAYLGEITCLPAIELDKLFWQPGMAATPHEERAAIQHQLAAQQSWIMDGDLGPQWFGRCSAPRKPPCLLAFGISMIFSLRIASRVSHTDGSASRFFAY
jgi:hypothetical protein